MLWPMVSRRGFLRSLPGAVPAMAAALTPPAAEPIIDIHQHTSYSGRSDAELIAHQREMGVSRTVLLPAGSKYGLGGGIGGNESVVALARQHRDGYRFFTNELPDIADARAVLEKYLRAGAIGIGEQKFPVYIDSPAIELLAEIAREYQVPVLLHFEHNNYNLGFVDFPKVVARHPKVIFIGHAQTWWGNIDKNHNQAEMYPKTPVTPGGITDRLLADFANVYGDMSAGSGLNSMLRDEEHARDFLKRHQNKLLFGSDCADRKANGLDCLGSKIIAAIQRLAPDKKAERKILCGNASRLLKIQV